MWLYSPDWKRKQTLSLKKGVGWPNYFISGKWIPNKVADGLRNCLREAGFNHVDEIMGDSELEIWPVVEKWCVMPEMPGATFELINQTAPS